MNYNWTTEFETLYQKAIEKYKTGTRGSENFFDANEQKFLASIGCTPQELYDFAEDANNYGEPDFGTTLLITAARRDYFLYVQKGKLSGRTVATSTLKAKTDAVDGIEWLPRIIQKARIKLAGELDKDLMFGCGGDRKFLSKYNIAPADFLRFVWAAKDDDRKIIDWVKSKA
ncbi:MAG: DUF5069 domain-containing protein [Verrucomicrobiales bacterium]|jgi:hypothetical protein|nr:DUF5069 domain-containing protein [Verrucomicrobiales bacterium]